MSESHCWRVCVVGCLPHLQPRSRQEEVHHGAAMCTGGTEIQSRKIMFQEILKMHITNSWVYPDPQCVKYCMPTASLRCIEKMLESYPAKLHRVISELFLIFVYVYFLWIISYIFQILLFCNQKHRRNKEVFLKKVMQEESCNILCKTLANGLLGIHRISIKPRLGLQKALLGLWWYHPPPIFTFLEPGLVPGMW